MMSDLKTHKVALFGFGRAGSIHFHNMRLSKRIQLKYIVDLEVDRATNTLKEFGLHEAITVVHPDDASRIWTDATVRAVVIATPTFQHEGQVRSALQNGKAVFCEKPISENIQSTRELYQIAEDFGQLLYCSFNRRFDPSFQEIRAQVKNGSVGNLLTLKATARDPAVPPIEYLATSGGMFHDCAIHVLDLLMWIVDEAPTEVFVMARAHSPEIAAINDVDTALINLRFPCGAVACADVSRYSNYGFDQRVEVHGTAGMLRSENQSRNNVELSNTRGVQRDQLMHNFPERYRESFQSTLQHFFDIIDGVSEQHITKKSTLTASYLAKCCQESHESGIAVAINLSEIL